VVVEIHASMEVSLKDDAGVPVRLGLPTIRLHAPTRSDGQDVRPSI